MKTRILLLAISAAFLSSCGTMYKSGQTPDDVYYSPGREQVGYVETKEDPEDNRRYKDEYTDDRYLRMKSSNQRWSAFDDDYMYWNNPTWNSQLAFNSWGSRMYGMNYGMGFGYNNMHLGFNNFWGNPYYLMNPFCPTYYGQPVVIINPKGVYKNPVANGPRTYNLNTYRNTGTNRNKGVYIDPKTGATIYGNVPSGSTSVNNSIRRSGVRVFNNVTTGSGFIDAIISSGSGKGGSSRPRGGYSNRDNNERSSGSPTRTFEPSRNNNNSSGNSAPSRSSGGSGSSGSSAPTRSFPRGGGN